MKLHFLVAISSVLFCSTAVAVKEPTVGIVPVLIPIILTAITTGVDGKLRVRSPSDEYITTVSDSDKKAGSSSAHIMESKYRRRAKAKGKKSKGKGKNHNGEECIIEDEDEDTEEIEAFQLLGKIVQDPSHRAEYTEDDLADLLGPHVDEVNELLPEGHDDIDHHQLLEIWLAPPAVAVETDSNPFQRQLKYELTSDCMKDLKSMLADVIAVGLYSCGLLGLEKEWVLGLLDSLLITANIIIDELITTWASDESIIGKILDSFIDLVRLYSLPHLMAYIWDHTTVWEFAISAAGLSAALVAGIASAGGSMIASAAGIAISMIDGIWNFYKAVTIDCKKKVINGFECSAECQGNLGGRGCCQGAGQSETCWLNDESTHTSCNNCQEEGKCYIDMTILKHCSNACENALGGRECCVSAGQTDKCRLNFGSPWTSCNNCMDEGPCEILMK